jgi:hypothetical protein
MIRNPTFPEPPKVMIVELTDKMISQRTKAGNGGKLVGDDDRWNHIRP